MFMAIIIIAAFVTGYSFLLHKLKNGYRAANDNGSVPMAFPGI